MSQDAQRGGESDPASRAADPSTSQAELHQLCAARPELRPVIAENPNAYPQLLEWLGRLGDPEVDAALARRGEDGQTSPLPDPGAETAGSAQEQTQEFGAVQQPPSTPGHAAPPEPSDFDQQVYGAPAASAHSGQDYTQPPVYAHQPHPGYPPPGYAYTPAASAEPDTEPRRRRGGGGCAIVFVLALITAAALVASYFLLFGNPLATDDDADPGAEQQEEVTPEDEQQGETASPEDAASPTEDTDDEEDTDEDAQARPAPDDALDITAFSAPSGNIHCTLSDDQALCTVDEHFFDAPSGCDEAVTVRVGADGAAETACDESIESQGQELNYGQITGNGDFACEATQTHFECWSQQTGNGFQLAREYYELYDY